MIVKEHSCNEVLEEVVKMEAVDPIKIEGPGDIICEVSDFLDVDIKEEPKYSINVATVLEREGLNTINCASFGMFTCPKCPKLFQHKHNVSTDIKNVT